MGMMRATTQLAAHLLYYRPDVLDGLISLLCLLLTWELARNRHSPQKSSRTPSPKAAPVQSCWGCWRCGKASSAPWQAPRPAPFTPLHVAVPQPGLKHHHVQSCKEVLVHVLEQPAARKRVTDRIIDLFDPLVCSRGRPPPHPRYTPHRLELNLNWRLNFLLLSLIYLEVNLTPSSIFATANL
jgi:hypothetical protein